MLELLSKIHFDKIIALSILIFLVKYLISNYKNMNKKEKRINYNQNIYMILIKIPIISSILKDIRSKLFMNRNADEKTLRHEAVIITFLSILFTITIFILAWKLYAEDFYTLLIIILFCIYINSIVINIFIGNVDKKILELLPAFIENTKHYFHEHKMADEAIYNASLVSHYYMEAHGMKIYNVLKKRELALEEYYNSCPNKFLKIIASFSYLTKEFKDKNVNGISLFVKNMNYLQEEINMEILKRSELYYWLKGMPIFVLIPILFKKPLQSWLVGTFPLTENYFNTTFGYALNITALVITFLCYYLLKQMQKNEDKNTHKIKIKDKYWESYFLKNKVINKIVQLYKPKKNSKDYKTDIILIQESGENLHIDFLYLRCILSSVISFILILLLINTAHMTNINRIINDFAYGQKLEYNQMLGFNRLTTEEDEFKIVEIDKEIIGKVSIEKNKVNMQEIIIKELERLGIKSEKLIPYSERILNKLNNINTEKFKWYELLIAVVFSIFASNIPTLFLKFKKNLRKVEMQEECFMFDMIILILMHFQNVSAEMILEWMERFSDVFKNPITKCISNMKKDKLQALNELKNDVQYVPFQRIIDKLIAAASGNVRVEEAFISLEIERKFYFNSRQNSNKQIVEKRKELAERIVLIPFFTVLFLYLIIPTIWGSNSELNNLFESIKSIQINL